MDAVYPVAASARARGLRRRRGDQRHRTMPVTFAEIKEVDEDKEENEEVQATSACSVASAECAAEESRRRLHELDHHLGREFAEFRRRRARRDLLRDPDEDAAAAALANAPAAAPPPQASRAASEPRPNPGPS